MKGKMQGLPAAGPEEATHEEDEAPGEAPEEGLNITTKNDKTIVDLVDPELVLNNLDNSFHIPER